MAETASYERQHNIDDTRARPSYWAWKRSSGLDNWSEVWNLDEHEDDKIKLIADNRKRYVVVLVYYIL